MNKLLLPFTFSVLIGLGSVALAQDSPTPRTPRSQQPSQQQQADPDEGQAVTVIGCLAKGTAADEYVITETKSGQKLKFGGPNQLDKYLNQTIQLSGTMRNRGGEKAFMPETVKPVSSSCEGSKSQ
jgi:hypothetical protein